MSRVYKHDRLINAAVRRDPFCGFPRAGPYSGTVTIPAPDQDEIVMVYRNDFGGIVMLRCEREDDRPLLSPPDDEDTHA